MCTYCLPVQSDDHGVSEDGDKEEECFISFTTSESRCDNLFDRGLDMVAQGNSRAALHTFLETLTALQECQYTNKLFPTLYQVAEVYKVLGEEEKFKEISDALSIMQEALNEAVRVKKGRGRGRGEHGDCGSLFLQKVATLERRAHDSEEKGDVTSALHLAESAFRVQQYTLGLRHPDTAQSLTNLMASYTKLGEVVHLANDADPILFTSVIKSSCQHPSATCTQSSSSHLNSHPTSHSQSHSQTTSHSDVSWNCEHCFSCSAEAPSEGCYVDSPSCLQGDTATTTQDVFIEKPQLECERDMKSDFPTVSHEPSPPSTDLTSVFTFLVIFSVTAIVALSFF